MKNYNRHVLIFFALALCSFGMLKAQPDAYPDPANINESLKKLQQSNPTVCKLSRLAESPGKKEVLILEIGKEISSSEKTSPAILVVGNLEGNRPIASLAALKLAEKILGDPSLYATKTWYIIPDGNPDAYSRYFASPIYETSRNAAPHNDDMDENTDEDGYNDLNGDGIITQMRVRHPEGDYIAVKDEPRLMRKVDPKKSEAGEYKLYTEGLDDDKDGKYNEDGLGGTNVNINFPHLFKAFDAESGLYPGSTPESRALIEFVYQHPEIAMAFSFGSTNFCYTAPKGGRKGDVDLTQIKIPERYASMFGADPEKSYTMKEIIEMVQSFVPSGMTVDESMVASFLGLGAVVNPLEEDLAFYAKFNEDYKKYLEGKGIKGERFDPQKAKDGSFELWSYYHIGIPVFSMDLWSIPKPAKEKKEGTGLDIDKLEKMTSEEFLALGEEKIAAFLKESGVPEEFSAKRLISMVESGQTNPKQMAGMMKQMPKKEEDEAGADPLEKAMLDYSDKVLGGKGFVNWEKYQHPDLGEVEIGGFVPFLATTPAFAATDSILDIHLPWIFELVRELPSLKIYETKVSSKGGGVYQLDLWVENSSFLSFPTAMGKRNKQPAPAVILLEGEGFSLLSGYARTSLGDLGGKSRKKLTWMVQTDKKAEIEVKLISKSAGKDQTTVKIGG